MSDMIITIGRQYGSGGRYVGMMLAQKLGIPFYDKELLAKAAEESGISARLLEERDEKLKRGGIFAFLRGKGDAGRTFSDAPIGHKIFLAQFDAIRRVADMGPCVIVGRCADYMLRDHDNVINVFIKASLSERVARATKYYGIDPLDAEDKLKELDKQRASYYKYYTLSDWGDMSRYDLCIDTGTVGVNGAVRLICACMDEKQNFKEEKAREEW